MARTQKTSKKAKSKMKQVQSLYYHSKKSADEGRLMNLVNAFSALKKNRGHKPKGIILNLLIHTLERNLSREELRLKTA